MNHHDIEIMKRWQKSPLEFIKDVWGLIPQPVKNDRRTQIEVLIQQGRLKEITKDYFEPFIKNTHITWQQWLIILAVERAIQRKGSNKISVVAGHGIGKSSALSFLILWFLLCFPDAQVPCTAPSSDLLHDVLWKELKIWLDRMPTDLSSLYEWTTGYLRIKQRPETWFARARTARKESPEALQGIHGEHVFICIEEASGVEEEIYRAGEGSLTGDNTLVLMISNGTRNMGYFYNSHHSFEHLYQTLQFNGEESPIVNQKFIDGIVEQYGRDSDEYVVRVKGGFPASEQMDETGWIPLITDRQILRVSDGLPFIGRRWLGIDPSGEGDDTTRWVLRDRFQARVVATENTSSDKSIAIKTYQLIKQFEIDPQDVVVGNFGVGADVRAELLLLDYKYDIRTVNEGDKASDTKVYANIRAEMAFRARTWLIRGGAVAGDELRRDITGYAYKHTIKDKKQLMDKPNLRKRIGRSPDRGDAFFMTFAYDESMDTHSNEVTNYPIQNRVEDIYSAL